MTTSYYQQHLEDLHHRLLGHAVVQSYLTGTGDRFDGAELPAAGRFELPFGVISTLEFAHLFKVFDGSRVHQQAEKKPSHDDAPPGMYFTVINNRLIQSQHKNRAGLVTEEIGTTDLYIDSLHIDHFFLNERNTPRSLDAFAFALTAITAHRLGRGLAHVSLVVQDVWRWMRRGGSKTAHSDALHFTWQNTADLRENCCRRVHIADFGRHGVSPCRSAAGSVQRLQRSPLFKRAPPDEGERLFRTRPCT